MSVSVSPVSPVPRIAGAARIAGIGPAIAARSVPGVAVAAGPVIAEPRPADEREDLARRAFVQNGEVRGAQSQRVTPSSVVVWLFAGTEKTTFPSLSAISI